MQRRTFLKVLGAGAAAIGIGSKLNQYLESTEFIPEYSQYKDWIQDKGSYLLVRIPDGKSMANVTFDKPTLFIMGEHSWLDRIRMNDYCNIYAPSHAKIINSLFDIEQSVIVNDSNRTAIKLCDNASNLVFAYNSIQCHGKCDVAFDVDGCIDATIADTYIDMRSHEQKYKDIIYHDDYSNLILT